MAAPVQEIRAIDSTTVAQAPLDILLRFFWRDCRQVHQPPHARQLNCLIENDEQERSKWVDVCHNGSLELGRVVAQVFSQRQAMWEINDEILSPKRGGPSLQGGREQVQKAMLANLRGREVLPDPAPSQLLACSCS